MESFLTVGSDSDFICLFKALVTRGRGRKEFESTSFNPTERQHSCIRLIVSLNRVQSGNLEERWYAPAYLALRLRRI
jgi:hypothetical protein